MFDIEASDEEITKKKKRTLLGLFILFFLVAGLGYFVTPNEQEPSQVALANEIPTPTFTLQPTNTPTTPPTPIPTVTSTSTPQPTATPSPQPATPTAVPPTVTPTSTVDGTAISAVDTAEQTGTDEADGNEFTPNVQTSEENAGEGGQSIAEGAVEQETASEGPETTGEATTESSTESSEITSEEQETEMATQTGEETSETGSEQTAKATSEAVSPEDLPTTGLDGLSWGMTWLALGTILVLIGFGVASASSSHSRWGD